MNVDGFTMDLDAMLSRNGGAVTRDELALNLGRHRTDNLVRTRTIERVFPRVYAWPWDVDLPHIRQRAALASVGGINALSHTDTLAAFALPGLPPCEPIHVSAYAPRHPRGVPGELIVHRTRIPLRPIEVNGLPHMPLAVALIRSWPLLADIDRRGPMIEAVRRKLVTVPALTHATADAWWLSGISDVRDLVSIIEGGCESMLELFGYTIVFAVPGLDDANRQLVMQVGDKSVRMDLAYEHERLNVELDGWRFHSSREQRERDNARDVLVAKRDWLTLRFSHERLHGDIEGVRADVLAVRAARRRAAA